MCVNTTLHHREISLTPLNLMVQGPWPHTEMLCVSLMVVRTMDLLNCPSYSRLQVSVHWVGPVTHRSPHVSVGCSSSVCRKQRLW